MCIKENLLLETLYKGTVFQRRQESTFGTSMQYMLLAVKKTISKPYMSLWDDFQDTESEKRQKNKMQNNMSGILLFV